MLRCLTLGLCLALSVSGASAQNRPALSTDDSYNQATEMVMAYSAVAQACGHREFRDLKTGLVQLLELQNRRRLLTNYGKRLYQDTERYLDEGVAEYRRRPYVTCGQAPEYYPQIVLLIRRLIAG